MVHSPILQGLDMHLIFLSINPIYPNMHFIQYTLSVVFCIDGTSVVNVPLFGHILSMASEAKTKLNKSIVIGETCIKYTQ